MTTQDVPPPGTGGCQRLVFSQNTESWPMCGRAVRPMRPEELAAHSIGGEEAVMALYPDLRGMVRWP